MIPNTPLQYYNPMKERRSIRTKERNETGTRNEIMADKREVENKERDRKRMQGQNKGTRQEVMNNGRTGSNGKERERANKGGLWRYKDGGKKGACSMLNI